MRGLCDRKEKCYNFPCSPLLHCLVKHIFLTEKEKKCTKISRQRGFQFPVTQKSKQRGISSHTNKSSKKAETGNTLKFHNEIATDEISILTVSPVYNPTLAPLIPK